MQNAYSTTGNSIEEIKFFKKNFEKYVKIATFLDSELIKIFYLSLRFENLTQDSSYIFLSFYQKKSLPESQKKFYIRLKFDNRYSSVN